MKTSPAIPEEIDSVLLTRQVIDERITELAAQIVRDYDGMDFLILGILKGAFVFMSDLIRKIPLPMEVDFLTISSYMGRTRATVEPYVPDNQWPQIAGRHVLLVEDILDSGRTMAYAARECLKRGAKSFRVCTLMAKEGFETSAFPNPDYVGFVIPNAFVVGYGLDFGERYRNLDYVGILNEEFTRQAS